VLGGGRDKEVVGAVEVIVEPRVDFYPALRAAECRPVEVVHVQADCGRVDELQVLRLLPISPAAQKFVVFEEVEVEFLEDSARPLLVRVREVRPRYVRPDSRVVPVVVACDRVLD